MTDAIRHPLQYLYALKSDPWRAVRFLVCVGIFVGFAFWDIHHYDNAPVSDDLVNNDKLVLMFSGWHRQMDQDHKRIPRFSSQVLAVQYVAIVALMLIFVSRGDLILVASGQYARLLEEAAA